MKATHNDMKTAQEVIETVAENGSFEDCVKKLKGLVE